MRAMNEFHWAQVKIDEVVTGKKHREKAACERRLRQMEARRAKEAARQAKKGGADMTTLHVAEIESLGAQIEGRDGTGQLSIEQAETALKTPN